MIEVPCTPNGLSRWQQNTTLDGRNYLLTFEWNQRDGGWYLALADAQGSVIATGRRLSTGFPLLREVRDARRPPGELVVADTLASDTREPDDPTFASLGARHVLVYLAAGEKL
jgi:hypothetical protein